MAGSRDVPFVGPAAAAERAERRMGARELPILRTELQRIARIQIRRVVQLLMAARGGVRPHAADSLREGRPALEHVREGRSDGRS